MPDTSNSAFCPSYAENSLTCKFELDRAILDFDRFHVRKNPIFHNSSRRPQMVRFVLVTLRAALPGNFSVNTAILDFLPIGGEQKSDF